MSRKNTKIVESEELASYKQKLFSQAEHNVKMIFPKKVIEFNELLNSPRFSYDRLKEIIPDKQLNIPIPQSEFKNGTATYVAGMKRKRVEDEDDDVIAKKPVIGFVNGTVESNAALGELMDEIRPKLRDAVEAVNTVKMWITLLIPRIEDGNNFGVGIQEETLNEVRNVESEAASFLDQMSRYFTTRGKLLTKVAKYPHVDDYRRAIQDMDEKQFLNIRLVVLEMRNHFSTLHDMIMKNYEKIKTPRNSNMEHLY